MKCIRCETDNNLQERTENQGRCKSCQHPFAFEPTSMGKAAFTDPFFLKSITDLSDNDVLFFTKKQFFYLLNKRLKKRRIMDFFSIFSIVSTLLFFTSIIFPISMPLTVMVICNFSKDSKRELNSRRKYAKTLIAIGVSSIIIGTIYLSLSPDVVAFIVFSFLVILGMISNYLGLRQLKALKGVSQNLLITSTQFQGWINTWIRANGSIEKMLPSPSTENQPTNLNPEITAYSFDRAIVCDSAEIAQFLIANNFHFENNCAVLSIDGYPQNIFSTVMEMLRRNPELKVYAIHDASPHGISLVNQLRTNSNWFANSSATVYDLGLSPRQVLRSRSLFIRNSSESKQRAARSPQSVKQELSPDELEWLEKGNFVELESLMPRRLLQVLTRGIALSQAPDVEDALIPVESDGGLVFATDSFG